MKIRLGVKPESGASAVEYAILVSLIAVLIIGAVNFFGGRTAGLFEKSCDSIAAATPAASCT